MLVLRVVSRPLPPLGGGNLPKKQGINWGKFFLACFWDDHLTTHHSCDSWWGSCQVTLLCPESVHCLSKRRRTWTVWWTLSSGAKHSGPSLMIISTFRPAFFVRALKSSRFLAILPSSLVPSEFVVWRFVLFTSVDRVPSYVACRPLGAATADVTISSPSQGMEVALSCVSIFTRLRHAGFDQPKWSVNETVGWQHKESLKKTGGDSKKRGDEIKQT